MPFFLVAFIHGRDLIRGLIDCQKPFVFFFVFFLVIDSINTFLHSLVEAKHPACKDESFDDTFDLAAVFFL